MFSNRPATYLNLNKSSSGKAFTFNLNLKPLEKINMSIVKFRMNHLINNITPKNNQLNFSTFSLTIPPNFYTAIQLRDKINELLSPHSITCIYQDFQFSFVSTHSFTIISTSTCKRVLGLSNENESATLYPAYTLVCPHKCDLNQHYIRILVPELSSDWLSNNRNRDKTLIQIPINCLYGQVIYFDTPISFLLHKTNLRTLNVILQDDYGNVIQDLDYDLTVKFEYVFLPPDLEIQEEEEKKDDDLDLSKFKHYDGSVKVKSISGFGL